MCDVAHSPKGRTPLSCAAEAGNDDIVGFLLTCRQTMSDTTSPEGSGVSKVSDECSLYNTQVLRACKGLSLHCITSELLYVHVHRMLVISTLCQFSHQLKSYFSTSLYRPLSLPLSPSFSGGAVQSSAAGCQERPCQGLSQTPGQGSQSEHSSRQGHQLHSTHGGH